MMETEDIAQVISEEITSKSKVLKIKSTNNRLTIQSRVSERIQAEQGIRSQLEKRRLATKRLSKAPFLERKRKGEKGT